MPTADPDEDPEHKEFKRTASFTLFNSPTTPRVLRPSSSSTVSPTIPNVTQTKNAITRPLVFSGGMFKPISVDVSEALFSKVTPPGSTQSGTSSDSLIFSKLDSSPLNAQSKRKASPFLASARFSRLTHFLKACLIITWVVAYRFRQTFESLSAYLTRLRPDFYDRIFATSKKLNICIAIRVQNDPFLPSNRRYSLIDHVTGKMIATGKRPPFRSKTNATNLLLGHIARRKELQEKPASIFDNSVPGAWPDAIKDDSVDWLLTQTMQTKVSPEITQVKLWHNLICWEEEVPEFEQIGDEIISKDTMAKKYFIQEAIHIYWLIDKIRKKNGPKPESGEYEFVGANNNYLLFKYNGELFKIKLDILMPPRQLLKEKFRQFNNIDGFANYIDEIGIATHHAPLFRISPKGGSVPEMVCCGRYGHITGDADAQFYGKRFDMPRVAYAIFWGEEPLDHPKFMHGLILLRERLLAKTQQEFRQFVRKYTRENEIDIRDYMEYADIVCDEKDFIIYNNDDGNEVDEERHNYYQNIFMPILEKTINKYTDNPEELAVVCHSDIYSLIVQVDIGDDNIGPIHAPEDTNQHPGELGAVLSCDDELLFVTENEVSLLASLFKDRKLLAEQVIGVNPYYLRSRAQNNELSLLWLDVLKIRCLNAALISDHEFRMHWLTIQRTFRIDKQNGPAAIAKVDAELNNIVTKLRKVEQEALGVAVSLRFSEADTKKLVEYQKRECIKELLDAIYEHTEMLSVEFNEKLKESAAPIPQSPEFLPTEISEKVRTAMPYFEL